MRNKLSWYRSEDGFTSSKCGRFEIHPVFCGRTTPVDYVLTDNKTGKTQFADTQKELKDRAETKLDREAL